MKKARKGPLAFLLLPCSSLFSPDDFPTPRACASAVPAAGLAVLCRRRGVLRACRRHAPPPHSLTLPCRQRLRTTSPRAARPPQAASKTLGQGFHWDSSRPLFDSPSSAAAPRLPHLRRPLCTASSYQAVVSSNLAQLIRYRLSGSVTYPVTG